MDAIEILRGTEPHPESPLPWEAYAGHTAPCFRARDAQYVGECRHTAAADAAHIVAAVNAAPVLLAEIDRLRAVVEAAREAVDCWPVPPHSFYCGVWRGPDGYDSRLCDCDVEQRRHDRAHARRALGLEPMPAPPEPQAVQER